MPFDVFISYSHYDLGLRNKLEKHLSNLEATEYHHHHGTMAISILAQNGTPKSWTISIKPRSSSS